MEADVTTRRLAWEPPAAIPLTDSESRADQADIWMQNGVPGVGSG